ncbi:MAG: UbiA family prenyltransferase [Candidatus Marinimicrobia bacterium]|jgi:1,4-dihydroxy-2-naphthoate octaprenyltransferase|nr:UbiA family prenyltransferase [Pelagibacterales bacterium]MBL6911629.1 UbiA family prenyltransferase [Candidatus Neomarinimicrobiota bacterium]MBT3944742.1 UbiA family prenyltransferase [Candidatus Neomarinimicrobiota bacterium]MBT4706721.1 UbiA family prenyltransferase [Candidatus Neomarinimicrobiota bacterium]MBT4925894.1 UbiA family prenyltransferase [Candidatus Neomarinimicrobiota bacterium]
MLKEKIMDLMHRSDFMTLSTSVSGNSSAANVYFANNGLDMYFFTFNPTRKAVQINFNPKVQCVVRPDGEDGIKELQIDGYATKIIDQSEKEKAREAVLKVTEAFSEYMHDDFLIANDVVGYYKIKPTVIKYVDFFADTQFEWMEIPENKPSIPSELLGGLRRSIQRWMTIVRAPFLTATIAPILLGSAIAYKQFGTFDWSIFWLVLLGAIFAQCGTNTINDYFDHKSRTDELNKLASPFNGGSRAIQSGLMTPANMLLVSVLFFGSTIGIGLELNNLLFGDYFAISVLMYLGLIGVFLGVMYTGFLKLAYNGLGDLAVFIGFGPLMVYGAAYMQNQSVDPLTTLLFSIPVGIFIALVLFINCFQDYNADKAANKNSWVVRLAGPGDKANYRAPFKVWKNLMMLSFMIILGASLYAGNLFTLIALFPLFIFNFASKKGNSWLDQWEKEDANLQQLPYELLIVNVSTIGIHFLTGILLTLGILISTWI